MMKVSEQLNHWASMARLTSSKESILSADQLDSIAAAFQALEYRAEAAEVEKAGAEDRCRMMFEAKNYWAGRASVAEAIVSDVNEVIGLLSEREWAEHCTKTETGMRLENLITELHDDAAEH